MPDNPPVLYMKLEKQEPGGNWEIILPLVNKRYIVEDEVLNKQLDLIFLIDNYEIEVVPQP